MPLDSMVCHQISAAEEARTYLEIIGHGARLDFQMLGLALRIAGVRVPVDPLYVAFSRAQITNADEVTTARTSGEKIVPVDLGAAPGSEDCLDEGTTKAWVGSGPRPGSAVVRAWRYRGRRDGVSEARSSRAARRYF